MKYVPLALLAAYAVALRLMISSEATMAILSSGGRFPAWAILAALVVLVLRIVVFVALPAALFARLGLGIFDAWPRIAHAPWAHPLHLRPSEAHNALKQKE
ncbi:MAG: hypothetical protein ABIP39_03485 [Polyangiaceae bacterium]